MGTVPLCRIAFSWRGKIAFVLDRYQGRWNRIEFWEGVFERIRAPVTADNDRVAFELYETRSARSPHAPVPPHLSELEISKPLLPMHAFSPSQSACSTLTVLAVMSRHALAPHASLFTSKPGTLEQACGCTCTRCPPLHWTSSVLITFFKPVHDPLPSHVSFFFTSKCAALHVYRPMHASSSAWMANLPPGDIDPPLQVLHSPCTIFPAYTCTPLSSL